MPGQAVYRSIGKDWFALKEVGVILNSQDMPRLWSCNAGVVGATAPSRVTTILSATIKVRLAEFWPKSAVLET